MIGVWPTCHHLGALLDDPAVAGTTRYHVELEGVLGHWLQLVGFLVAVLGAGTASHALGAATVVGEKENKGVVELLAFLEGGDDGAHALVEPVHHGCVNLHVAEVPFLVWGVCPLWSFGVARSNFPILVHQPHLDLTFVTGLTHDVPTLVVLSFVLGDVFWKSMHRPVGCCVGNVHEERLFTFVFSDVAGGVIVYGVGVVELLGLVFLVRQGRDEGVFTSERIRVEEAPGPVDGAVETVEAALARPVVGGGSGSYMGGDVPLARHVGGVACCLHDLCDGTDVLAEVTPIAGEFLVSHHPSDARLVSISACK